MKKYIRGVALRLWLALTVEASNLGKIPPRKRVRQHNGRALKGLKTRL